MYTCFQTQLMACRSKCRFTKRRAEIRNAQKGCLAYTAPGWTMERLLSSSPLHRLRHEIGRLSSLLVLRCSSATPGTDCMLPGPFSRSPHYGPTGLENLGRRRVTPFLKVASSGDFSRTWS